LLLLSFAVYLFFWEELISVALSEARKIYEFEVCGLRVEADRVLFYINAADWVAVIRLNRE
jgi:hypothetical protein